MNRILAVKFNDIPNIIHLIKGLLCTVIVFIAFLDLDGLLHGEQFALMLEELIQSRGVVLGNEEYLLVVFCQFLHIVILLIIFLNSSLVLLFVLFILADDAEGVAVDVAAHVLHAAGRRRHDVNGARDRLENQPADALYCSFSRPEQSYFIFI